ncbi:hypothetical protein [Nevskia sp.]|uniref:hypothetical protein n=1 Tax=Nevskia sp. TaxID=1929292 RepID=UPI0025E7766D|nr:hypothetical protein [Nevskia sp.]
MSEREAIVAIFEKFVQDRGLLTETQRALEFYQESLGLILNYEERQRFEYFLFYDDEIVTSKCIFSRCNSLPITVPNNFSTTQRHSDSELVEILKKLFSDRLLKIEITNALNSAISEFSSNEIPINPLVFSIRAGIRAINGGRVYPESTCVGGGC